MDALTSWFGDNAKGEGRDAVAACRDYSGKLRIDQSCHMTMDERAAWGGLLGSRA